mmetsp:Transcript_19414/g.49767  ORF Transcript_19414/g.49767 Transcript_19414/m.49767 type:complete len:340 (-) Transcript_19414:324-1343(-)
MQDEGIPKEMDDVLRVQVCGFHNINEQVLWSFCDEGSAIEVQLTVARDSSGGGRHSTILATVEACNLPGLKRVVSKAGGFVGGKTENVRGCTKHQGLSGEATDGPKGCARGTKPAFCSLYVGQLSSRIHERELLELFLPFGKCAVRPVKRESGKCCFYTFVDYLDMNPSCGASPFLPNGGPGGGASRALSCLHGVKFQDSLLQIRASHRSADKGVFPTLPNIGEGGATAITLDNVLRLSAPRNTSLFVGNITFPDAQQDASLFQLEIRKAFSKFGMVVDVHTFPSRGFSFVRFSNHEEAGKAILGQNGYINPALGNMPLVVNWSKDPPAPRSSKRKKLE